MSLESLSWEVIAEQDRTELAEDAAYGNAAYESVQVALTALRAVTEKTLKADMFAALTLALTALEDIEV